MASIENINAGTARMRICRANMTSEARQRERDSNRERMRRSRERGPQSYHNIGRLPNVNANRTQSFIGELNKECPHCKALFFPKENLQFVKCCDKGRLNIPDLNPIRPEIESLMRHNEHFRSHIIAYNCALSFTSIGAKSDNRFNNNFNYSYTICGQMYHLIGRFEHSSETIPAFLQIYFLTNEGQVDARMSRFANLNRDIVTRLTNLLVDVNPFARAFKNAHQRISSESIPNARIRLIPAPGRYALPTINEVAVLMPGELEEERDIILHQNDGTMRRISQNNAYYIPLAYPLLFPEGEVGYSPRNSTDIASRPGQSRIAKSPTEFYRYRLQIRRNQSKLLMMGRLLQQYIVDAWTIAEQDRLCWVRHHQQQLRVDLYSCALDAVERGFPLANIGRRLILPSSFTGGPRYMTEKYMDAMAIVGKLGKPDLFITMTCNTEWPEIKSHLTPGFTAFDRPDICARVFYEKFKLLKEHITVKSVLGKVKAFVYVIEFQKRGLPHCHMLLIFEDEDKLRTIEDYDRVVSAVIPDQTTHPEAYETVTKCMIHRPCGDLYPDRTCMVSSDRGRVCSKRFPKELTTQTRVDNNGYPIYRRNSGRSFVRNGHLLDDRWVVPHNLHLCTLFDCHINVEVCSTVTAVKYLYKYVYKGHDKARVEVTHTSQTENTAVDEVKLYLDTRYVSAIEAFWRLSEFELNTNSPSVIHLDLHLENEQNVLFNDNDQVINTRETTLTAWLSYNATHFDGRAVLYSDFPSKYVYRNKQWAPRLRGTAIGRIYTVTPTNRNKEKYFLRVLLLNVPGATSFASLKTVGGTLCETYQEAAEMLNLVQNDMEWERCLREAALFQKPRSLRQLFCVILLYCSPSHPEALYRQFKSEFIADFLHHHPNIGDDEAERRALAEMHSTLKAQEKSLRDYLPQYAHAISSQLVRNRLINEETVFNPETRHQMGLEADTMYDQLTRQQKFFADAVILAMNDNNLHKRIFFLDGPGGSGKTFVYKFLIKRVRSTGDICLAVASSGIAALLLPLGRTAHSRFHIPLKIFETSVCSISGQSEEALLLQQAKLIIWDEAVMLNKFCFESVDRLYQDLMKDSRPFGGKCVIFGGDFRQILPIVKRGTEYDIIASSLINSHLWRKFERFTLIGNMRLITSPNHPHLSSEFSDYLIRIGEGRHPERDGYIELDPNICSPLNEFEDFIKNIISENQFHRWTVLTTKNSSVDSINSFILAQHPGESYTFLSQDSVCDEASAGLFPLEFLNSLNISGIPPHRLVIKQNSRVILMRNLNPSVGLCNGTQLKIIGVRNHVLIATVLSTGHNVFLPRIDLTTLDSDLPFTLKRRQYPIRPAFAMTINKSQGQTLDKVAIHLQDDVFSHGQLYVAMSRVKTKESLKIFTKIRRNKYFAKNIVYKDIISATNSGHQY